jgi:hypothetical protein
MEMDPHPLGQLAQGRLAEAVPEVGLAHQDDLQERLLVGLDIGEEPQFLERRSPQIMRLIDDEDDMFPPAVSLDEELIEGGQAGGPAVKLPVISNSLRSSSRRSSAPKEVWYNTPRRCLPALALRRDLIRVVLPVPISPVNTTKPSFCVRPYSR